MNNRNIKDYLVSNYATLITESVDSGTSFTDIARHLIEYDQILAISIPDRLRKSISLAYNQLTGVITSVKKSRVLVIGDLHEPFCLDGYLEFCQKQYKKWNCNRVVFIGDIIDNHYTSYHETDADGMGGGDELAMAKSKIAAWYEAFPEATVTLGNHDIMISRKAQSGQIPKAWIKEYKEVLGVPNWNFVEEVIIDDVLYHHGIGAKAHMKAKNNMISTVGGHWHTQAYVQWMIGKQRKVFGMQVGCGVNNQTYAMAYGKWFPKPAISLGVVIKGELPFVVMMDL